MKKELSLVSDGVEMYTYPASIRAHVASAAEAWQGFLALDQNMKNRFAAESLQFAIGYEKKGNGERESNDIKENFDVNRASLKYLSALSQDNKATSHFIAAISSLFDDL